MKKVLPRISVLTRVLFVALLMCCIAPLVAQDSDETTTREFDEVRIYRIFDYKKQAAMEAHLRDAYLPALQRIGIDRVGVFSATSEEETEHSVFVVIPFMDANQFANLRDSLNADTEYAVAEAAFSDRPLDDPIYTQVESWFLKSFTSIPKMELAEYTTNKSPDRVYELRLYQSHTDDHARRKVEMFNDGETQLMRDVKMAPVFFGETLAGPDSPNLIYMLSAENAEAHKDHWKAFLADPRWPAMRDLPEFKDTVSNIKNWMLKPTDFSGF